MEDDQRDGVLPSGDAPSEVGTPHSPATASKTSSRNSDGESPAIPDITGWYDRPLKFLEWLARVARKAKAPRFVTRAINGAANALLLYFSHDYNLAHAEMEHAQYFSMPDGEEVVWPVFWISEAYPPSSLGSLLDGLEKAGWTKGDIARRPVEVREWVTRARARPGASGTWNLVTIYPKNSLPSPSTGPFGGVAGRLPDGVARVSIHLHQRSESLTILHAAFFLESSQQGAFDRKLREVTPPRIVRRYGRRAATQGTFDAKREDLKEIRISTHARAQEWLANIVPGYFSVARMGKPPVVDLLLTKVGKPGADEPGLGNCYLSELGLQRSYGSWLSRDFDGLSMHDRDESVWVNHGHTLAARLGDVASNPRLCGRNGTPLDSDTLASTLNRYHVPGLATCLMIDTLLESMREGQARTRDLAKATHGRGSSKAILGLRDQVLESSLDIVTVSRDLRLITAEPRWFARDVLDFNPADPDFAEGHSGLVEAHRRHQRSSAKRLAADDEQLRGVLGSAARIGDI